MLIENNRSYVIGFFMACLVLLSACTSTSTAVNVRDIDTIPPAPVANERVDAPTQAKSVPIYQEATPQTLPIVERLFQQADAALQARNWQQAIALAEKGLRIERKEPRYYWVLATAYAQLSDKKQSQNFARQGLRYTSKGSRLARQLNAYLS